jgi:hypothetical protein
MNGSELLLGLVKVHRKEDRSSSVRRVIVIVPKFMKSVCKHTEIFVLLKLPVGKLVSIFSAFYDLGSNDNIKVDIKGIIYGIDLPGL